MPVLVSCRHCKRAVLISAHVTEREIGALADHLAACEPPVRVVGGSGAGMMSVLRYFRVAEIDRDRRADRRETRSRPVRALTFAVSQANRMRFAEAPLREHCARVNAASFLRKVTQK